MCCLTSYCQRCYFGRNPTRPLLIEYENQFLTVILIVVGIFVDSKEDFFLVRRRPFFCPDGGLFLGTEGDLLLGLLILEDSIKNSVRTTRAERAAASIIYS